MGKIVSDTQLSATDPFVLQRNMSRDEQEKKIPNEPICQRHWNSCKGRMGPLGVGENRAARLDGLRIRVELSKTLAPTVSRGLKPAAQETPRHDSADPVR